MTERLKNKVALITCGTTGIGLATAKRFAAEGAEVIVTGHNPDTLEEARQNLDETVKVVDSDAADERKVSQLFEVIRRKHGRLDILVLNAAHEASPSDFDAMWNENVRTLWLALKYALPVLSKGSEVIVNSAIANPQGFDGLSAYKATNAAVQSLVSTAARELAARKVRIEIAVGGE